MKLIAITQRVTIVKSYKERRDSLDQRWIDFLFSINLFPIIIPNNIEVVRHLLKANEVHGVLLTGGDSLIKYGGDTSERDKVEFFLIDWAIKNNIPLLGVCRGMQVIQEYFNNELVKVSNHVSVRHKLVIENNGHLSELCKEYNDVNSFHNYGSYEVGEELKKVAASLDGVVMAIEHQKKDIYGVMWHMERDFPFCNTDQELFKNIFFKNSK